MRFAVLVSIAGFALAGCTATVCAPGLQVSCPCLNAPDSVQSCSANGMSWEPCACGATSGDMSVAASADMSVPATADMTVTLDSATLAPDLLMSVHAQDLTVANVDLSNPVSNPDLTIASQSTPDLVHVNLPDLATPDFVHAASCSDGVRNGSESDIDCGGGSCAACATGKTCGGASDCVSGICTSGTCQPQPTCTDGIKNGSETDIDCGGSTCPKCTSGKSCSAGSDCSSGACGGTCCATGFADCDHNTGNGCEANLASDAKNCGACGTVCSSGTCSGSACTTPVTPVTYSAAFTNGVEPTQAQCDNWDTFRANLVDTYSYVNLKGTFDATGVTCTGPTADKICQAISGGNPTVIICNNTGWYIDTCNGGVEVSTTIGQCQCDAASGYTLRPCVYDGDWGGVNSATCDAPSQRITITCK